MTTPTHTPGPWRVAWGKIVDQSDKSVCLLTPRKDAVNSHVIAASPDMLQALQAMVDAFGDQDSLLIDQCKAALNKAIGKQ
jgi:hypothetical protein